jgi:hypothetical protein
MRVSGRKDGNHHQKETVETHGQKIEGMQDHVIA